MEHRRMIETGGLALIAFSLIYYGMHLFLNMQHNFPAILIGSVPEVLPRLLAGGETMRSILTFTPLLLLLLIPASVGAYYALKKEGGASLRIGVYCATFAAFIMVFAALRWPSINWILAEIFVTANPMQQSVIASVYTAMNTYLGLYAAHLLGDTLLSLWIVIISCTILRSQRFPNWLAYFGFFVAAFIFLIFFAYQSPLLMTLMQVIHIIPIGPIWFLSFGVCLYTYNKNE